MALVASDLGLGVDSHAYWAAWRGEMYDHAPATRDAFLYSPAFAQAIWPLAQLPWPVFAVVWGLAATATVTWLATGARRAWVVPLSLLGTLEVLTGNVNWVLALVALLGLRHPGLWTIALLTKVTPALGPIWFLARGEWRSLGRSVTWAVAVTAVSIALAPELWRAWWEFLSLHAASTGGTVGSDFLPPLAIRLPVVLAFLVWGARTDRVWTLPVSMTLMSPVSGIGQIVVLLALPRLVRTSHADESSRRQAVGI
ncbi:glycosyltransferase family 87 protein [Nocardioides sp. Soil774]|uniref:glycosyltransferase family 87 protein n=1 Tax=Nocardioides sp. Soil774 TaxID=1736408 RepID=UPI0012F960B1|nr:glycosyltransferase family 87 protein [Nocardioides sp. Soil774]